MGKIEDSYLVKRGNANYAALSSMFSGLKVLSVTGFFGKGEPVNVYTAQWTDSQREDCMVTTDVNGSPTVVYKNVDIELTFIVSDRYADIDVASVHDSFISYVTNGAFWLKSLYSGRQVECICLSSYSPTQTKLGRKSSNYITGTVKLHALDAPSSAPTW